MFSNTNQDKSNLNDDASAKDVNSKIRYVVEIKRFDEESGEVKSQEVINCKFYQLTYSNTDSISDLKVIQSNQNEGKGSLVNSGDNSNTGGATSDGVGLFGGVAPSDKPAAGGFRFGGTPPAGGLFGALPPTDDSSKPPAGGLFGGGFTGGGLFGGANYTEKEIEESDVWLNKLKDLVQ